jgi:rRNA maturation endonuclease Nob1
MKSWRIMCEECDMETHLVAEEYCEIEFCPCCGRRAEPEDITNDEEQV